ncbi:MAG: site-specific DNA-methyltransferase [Desulfobacterales bacterium]|nr:site-specific DNA-methyltransferase [Desulfobacterales bacterium]
MKTAHRVHFRDARKMKFLPDASIDLVLTSPPYPMIAMWDETFTALSPAAGKALKRGDGRGAFSAMHRSLEPVWAELYRVLRPGGLACINIGDATRTVGGRFMLYPNHARILAFALELGFTPLPAILWRKPTNAPTKFLGSGMFPAGAYVTLEHEYILVLRKSDRREFDAPDAKQRRRESAIFWEERNAWFSDVWMDLRGSRQALGRNEAVRARSGAFPPELAYRLILMFSVKGDTVLDPFLGTGTTLKSAAMAGRNSVGIEIQKEFRGEIFAGLEEVVPAGRARIRARIDEHLAFLERCRAEQRAVKHVSRHYGFPVVTRQETGILLNLPEELRVRDGEGFEVSYRADPHRLDAPAGAPATPPAVPSGGQIPLF